MDTHPPPQPFNRQVIRFSNGNRAQAVLPPINVSVTDLVQKLNLPQLKALIMIAGGASNLDTRTSLELSPLFRDGIASVAASLDALIIDGGTQAGVMELMGLGVAQQHHKATLLGVAPAGSITYPGKPTSKTRNKKVPLDPNHSHFVLVESDVWGGETETMYALAHVLCQGRPSVAMLIDGGAISKSEVLHNVRQKRPTIIIEGSGRFADEIARTLHEKPPSLSDPVLAEIIADGDLHLFPLTRSAGELEQLTQRLLRQQEINH